MKKHTSMKYFNNFEKVFRVGYCDLQDIYKYSEPQFYNSDVYGWNCDIYVDYARDIAITTGYRNMTGKRIPDELIEKYTANAKKILEEGEWKKPYEEYMKELEKNREEFLNELDKI